MTTEEMDPGVHSAQLSVDLVAECMLYAENELSALYCAVNQLFGLEQAQLTMEDWFSELETMEWPQESPVPNSLRPTLAGEVLAGQTGRIVDHWRGGIIAGIPGLARHSRSPEGDPLPGHLAATNLRFRQWILDACLRPYDQTWLDYQQEIALRHTSVKKNKVNEVRSTSSVPLRDVIAFVPVMNETILPYLDAKGHDAQDVDKMHRAWCKLLQLQLALLAKTYIDHTEARSEW